MANGYNAKRRLDIGERPICPDCNKRERMFNGFSRDGRPLFRSKCRSCGRIKTKQLPYKEAVKRKKATMTCERCGFKAEDPCQLDIDHIDGNRKNNDPSNHQVLCANCHRLKGRLNNDY